MASKSSFCAGSATGFTCAPSAGCRTTGGGARVHEEMEHSPEEGRRRAPPKASTVKEASHRVAFHWPNAPEGPRVIKVGWVLVGGAKITGEAQKP